MAPQALSLNESLSGEENLLFFGRLYGLRGPALKERVARVLELVGLTDRRRDRLGTYSGGMKRRLNLACALVHDPPVLFLDEPTAGVDPQSRNHLYENIEALAREGRTVLYTTHYMEEAQRLCRRVAVMDHGKILALDTVPGPIARYGGRSVVEVELAGPPPEAVAATLQDGNRLCIETDRPLEELARLAAAGVKAVSFRLEQPDLETVFLALTGRRLRD
jgi:ABC-2 type transport system ATP-binding protein